MSDDLAAYRDVNSSLITDLHVLLRRRVLFASLVGATSLLFALWFYHVVAAGGFGLLEVFLVFLFLVQISWLALDFWNAIMVSTSFIPLTMYSSASRRRWQTCRKNRNFPSA